jgi:hypothetical protein
MEGKYINRGKEREGIRENVFGKRAYLGFPVPVEVVSLLFSVSHVCTMWYASSSAVSGVTGLFSSPFLPSPLPRHPSQWFYIRFSAISARAT